MYALTKQKGQDELKLAIPTSEDDGDTRSLLTLCAIVTFSSSVDGPFLASHRGFRVEGLGFRSHGSKGEVAEGGVKDVNPTIVESTTKIF